MDALPLDKDYVRSTKHDNMYIYIYIYFKMHRLLCIICKHPVVEKRLKNIGDYKTSHQFRMLSFTERFAGSPGGSISS